MGETMKMKNTLWIVSIALVSVLSLQVSQAAPTRAPAGIYYAEIEIKKPAKNKTELEQEDGLEALKKIVSPIGATDPLCETKGVILDAQTVEDNDEIVGKATVQLQVGCAESLEQFVQRINDDQRLRLKGKLISRSETELK